MRVQSGYALDDGWRAGRQLQYFPTTSPLRWENEPLTKLQTTATSELLDDDNEDDDDDGERKFVA